MTGDLRLALVDDAALFRRGLQMLLEAAGVQVVVALDQAREPYDWIDRHRPDVVVLDVRMPPTHTDEGIVAAGAIRRRWPALGVCVLSTYLEPSWALRLLDTVHDGVGYLLKDRVDDVEALVAALRRVAAGGVALDPEVVVAMIAARRHAAPMARLTPRELEVLRLLAEGLSNTGISERLVLSPRTVENHVAHVFRALDLGGDQTTNQRVQAALAYLTATGVGSGGGSSRR